jgi:hypothetical protein
MQLQTSPADARAHRNIEYNVAHAAQQSPSHITMLIAKTTTSSKRRLFERSFFFGGK